MSHVCSNCNIKYICDCNGGRFKYRSCVCRDVSPKSGIDRNCKEYNLCSSRCANIYGFPDNDSDNDYADAHALLSLFKFVNEMNNQHHIGARPTSAPTAKK
jgi:hypothetical protein